MQDGYNSLRLYRVLALRIMPVAVILLLIIGYVLVDKMTNTILSSVNIEHQEEHRYSQKESKTYMVEQVKKVKYFLMIGMLLNISILLFTIVWISRIVVRPVATLLNEINLLTSSSESKCLLKPSGIQDMKDITDAFNQLISELMATMVSRSYLYRIINSMVESVFTTNMEGQIIATNPAFCTLFGYPSTVLTGMQLERVFPPDTVKEILVDVKVSGTISGREVTAKDSKGNELTFLLSCATMPTDIAANMGIVHVVHDITARKKMEVEIKSQQERLDMVIKAANIGLWDWNIKTGDAIVNDRWGEMFGYTLHELYPISIYTWMTLVHPEDIKMSKDLLKKHFSGEVDSYDCEFRMRHKDGHWVWIHDKGKVVEWGDNGRALRMSGTHSDITERKNVQQKLRESEANFRTFFESIGDMITVCNMDGKILYTNHAVEETLGYSYQEIGSMHIIDMHPYDQRQEAQLILKSMFQGERATCNLPLVSRDGKTIIPVETRVWCGKWDGYDCIFGISKDMTLEQEAKQRFESLFRNNPALMALTSLPERRFIDVNDALLSTLGYERDEIIGRTIGELDIFVTSFQTEAVAQQLQLEGRIYNCELRVRCKNGKILDGLFSGEIIRSHGQLHLLTVMIDITDRKEAELRLLQAHDMMEQQVMERTRALEETHSRMLMHEKMASVGQLAAGIAHELNNPINFVRINFATLTENFTDIVNILKDYRAFVSEMANSLDDPDKNSDNTEKNSYDIKTEGDFSPSLHSLLQKDANMQIDLILDDIPVLFEESERGFERIARIIQSVKDFSHVDHTGMYSLFNINKCIEDTLVIAKNVYKYHADVKTDLGELKEILCYPEQLNQVFLNLIINSSQSIESQNRQKRGLIKIRTWYDSRWIYCEIEDNGTGIPAEFRSRIFEPFFTTKPPGQGTGLGLSIAYDIIVKRHKGELEVESPDGGGSIFRLKIPLDIESVEVNHEKC